MITAHRRGVLAGAAAMLAGAAARAQPTGVETLPFENGERRLVAYPQKRPMLVLTQRPPQLETPFEVFDQGVFTPNDAFFVRYHLAGAPPRNLDAARHRLKVSGAVTSPLDLGMADLRRDFPAVELAAVNQCSGNGRGFSAPRVGGGQLGEGAMGNALWRGIRLRDLLDRAGVKPTARNVEFNGADNPPLTVIPDFVKALDIDHARQPEVMLAYEMNGAELPLLNGYPLRLIVPGYYGTYWVKHLSEITLLEGESQNFFMKTAYRVPDNECACTPPGVTTTSTRPIGRLNVRSFITNLRDGQKVRSGPRLLVRGVAFDGGHGIESVSLSADGGASWTPTTLGPDHGPYSFREWSTRVALPKGPSVLMARARNKAGELQALTASWNQSGYMRNAPDLVRVSAS